MTDVAPPVAGALAVSTSPRVPMGVVVNVGANHKVASPLVLRFKEVEETQVSVGFSNGAVVDVSKMMTLGTSQISFLPLHWQLPEHISDPLGH